MYSEWVSLSENIKNDTSNRSVLSSYPSSVGRDVARTVVRSLVENSAESNEERFSSSKDVEWLMQVICFGLGLPLSEGETLKHCVTVYLDWLSALSSQAKQEVPKEVLRQPNLYCQSILQHLRNLFVPKSEGTLALQASLCMKVLQSVQRISHECSKMNKRTLNILLQFLLSVSDLLLSPPYVAGGLTEQLSSFLIEVLFDVWLQACVWAFPEPPLWKTLQEMCTTWRHHSDVVALWNKTIFSITRRVLLSQYGSSFPLYPLEDKKHEIRIPTTIDNKCLIQSWFRFLHVMGNPVDLCNKEIISNTAKFKEHALLGGHHEPALHPCLNSMPDIFYTSLKGVAALVDTLLGSKCNCESPVMFCLISPAIPNFTVSLKSIDKKKVSSAISTDQLLHISSGNSENQAYIFNQTMVDGVSVSPMPIEDSILHLLGPWLFQAALANTHSSSIHKELVKNSLRIPKILQSEDTVEDEKFDDFEQGRAEAFGALCRIFCSQKSSNILPVYLSRFYFTFCAGLFYDKTCTGHVLSSILLNSINLLRVNLPGVNVVLPHLISALEIVLCQNDLKMRCNVPMVQLQRAAIHLLLSMLCLPHHFEHLVIGDVSNPENNCSLQDVKVTFISLKPRITELLMCALENETDSYNTQMLLGGAMLFTQDSALVERDKRLSSDTSHVAPLTKQVLKEVLNENSSDENSASENEQNSDIDITKSPQIEKSWSSQLFVHLTNLVNQKLIFGSKWKSDFHVTLSAFELMSGIATMTIPNIDKDECKKTVQWLCDYVEFQAKQPAPFHSRDLHSMMVAAFTCLLTWITSHPWLLEDQKSLQAILAVVELGISGTRSKATENQPENTEEMKTRLKGEKVLKPASFRVREAAEGVLSCIMELVGAFPSPCGPASTSSLLDEEILMQHITVKEQQKENFQYFVIDETIIVGILQESVQVHDALTPTATVLLRGPTNRTTWTVELRQIPECKKELLSQHNAPARPPPNFNFALTTPINHQHFPSEINVVPLAKANMTIPAVQSIPCEKLNEDKDNLEDLIEKQRQEEVNSQDVISKEKDNSDFPCSFTEIQQPRPVTTFSACRMILARLGLLRPEEYDKAKPSAPYDRAVTSLSPLDKTNESFGDSLKELDHLPTRCFDSVHVFYVKQGQHDAKEIVNNQIKHCANKKMFYEFLQLLGWPIEVENHSGWTGNPSTSWKLSHLKTAHLSEERQKNVGLIPQVTLAALDEENNEDDSNTDQDGNADKNLRILYFGDVSCEIAFIVPSLFPRMVLNKKKSHFLAKEGGGGGKSMKRPVSVANLPTSSSSTSLLDVLPETTRGLSLSRNTADTTIDLRHLSKLNTHSPSSETNILVVWLEKFVDHEKFPDNEILYELSINKESGSVSSPSGRAQEKERAVIFICPLHNGLFRIRTKSTVKTPMAGPLVDGMVVSRRSLASMVRQTAINIGRRRRLYIDNYSPPYVCRKLKIQDIVRKCRQKMSFSDFYASLFKNQQ